MNLKLFTEMSELISVIYRWYLRADQYGYGAHSNTIEFRQGAAALRKVMFP